jgi:lysophospholipase L1-like esterase
MKSCGYLAKSILFTCCIAALPAAHLMAAESRVLPTAAKPKAAPATSAPASSTAGVVWEDARGLTIEGKGWNDTEQFYERLPAKAKGVATDAVWGLGKNTAGMCVRFSSDSNVIRVRWTLTSANLALPHMAATGASGIDLYVRQDGKWQWLGCGRPTAVTNEWALAEGIPAGSHDYIMYLPLYNGVKSLEIGIAEQASLRPAQPRLLNQAICFYGTSIMQGGCASRPGMGHAQIIGRMLDRPIINLGFSGSGKMEIELAEFIAELDPAMFVLDCLPNMTAEWVSDRVVPFVRVLRKARPSTPIVLVEHPMYDHGRVLPKIHDLVVGKNQALRTAYEQLIAEHVTGLTYVPSEKVTMCDGEGTVDGVHPTDLGFQRLAESLTPVLRKVLAGE